jgi:hypothetical protein
MQQIVEYRERRLGARRDFTLLDDAVSVRGKTFLLSEFDSTVPLRVLLPTPSRAKIRTPTFLAGLAFFLFAVTLVSMFWGGPGPKQNLPIYVLGCLLTLLGLIVGLAIFRKVEFVQFQNEAGLTVLDIARAGPDARSLDAFVGAIVDRIHQLRMSPNSTVDSDARKSGARGLP